MNTLEFKGYHGEYSYDFEAEIYHGDMLHLKDVITFQSKDVEGLQKAFEESIADYEELLAEER